MVVAFQNTFLKWFNTFVFMVTLQNPKLHLCKQHFPLEALSIYQPPNIVPQRNMLSAQLQFWIYVIIYYNAMNFG